MQKISSWGRLSRDLHHVVMMRNPLKKGEIKKGIAYGMGRSYGDVCLNPNGILWNTTKLDHFIAFDENTGRLICEAGVLLRDIQRLLVPRGWMLPVTPGTQLITVGGAIANDVHGKNHHVFGSFGNHIKKLKLIRTNGEMIECSPENKPDWFAATIGGLGLTGIIFEAEIQLRKVSSPWLTTESISYHHLEEFFQLSHDSEANWENTVSWIDCLAKKDERGIFMRANFKESNDLNDVSNNVYNPFKKTLTIPFFPSISFVNALTLKPFNAFYFYLKSKGDSGKLVNNNADTSINNGPVGAKNFSPTKNHIHYEPFLYPLDNISDWNKLYGPKGFYQYQSVVPRETGQEMTKAMLKAIAQSGEGSFLSVLKTFGDIPSLGMMSFPKKGVTLALDFPNTGQKTLQLFEQLDAIVREAGGRIYPAKDARMPRDLFESGYPRLKEFLKYRDPGMSSSLSRRLMD